MQNVKFQKGGNLTLKENELAIIINVEAEIGPSKSGKTVLIATTGGGQQLDRGVFVNLTAYKYPMAKAKKEVMPL